MYAIYGNIYYQYTPNVSIYTIHGSYGTWHQGLKNSRSTGSALPRVQVSPQHLHSTNHCISQSKEKIDKFDKAFVSRFHEIPPTRKVHINPEATMDHQSRQLKVPLRRPGPPNLQICDSSGHPLRLVQHLSGSQAQCLLSFFQLSCLQKRAEELHQFQVYVFVIIFDRAKSWNPCNQYVNVLIDGF